MSVSAKARAGRAGGAAAAPPVLAQGSHNSRFHPPKPQRAPPNAQAHKSMIAKQLALLQLCSKAEDTARGVINTSKGSSAPQPLPPGESHQGDQGRADTAAPASPGRGVCVLGGNRSPDVNLHIYYRLPQEHLPSRGSCSPTQPPGSSLRADGHTALFALQSDSCSESSEATGTTCSRGRAPQTLVCCWGYHHACPSTLAVQAPHPQHSFVSTHRAATAAQGAFGESRRIRGGGAQEGGAVPTKTQGTQDLA